VSGLNQKTLPTESQDLQPHITHEYNLSTRIIDTTREDMLSSSLYLQTPTSNQERLLHSIEECGTSCYRINTTSHSLDAQELISTTSTGQQKNQTTTTEGHSIVDSHQNLLKKRAQPTYKSETHQYLQSAHWTLPHHTAQERQNQAQQTYQSSRHRQYNAVALLLLKRNNYKPQWR
jgi:predicted transcriptional regulator